MITTSKAADTEANRVMIMGVNRVVEDMEVGINNREDMAVTRAVTAGT
jgi:hypothetical protein